MKLFEKLIDEDIKGIQLLFIRVYLAVNKKQNKKLNILRERSSEIYCLNLINDAEKEMYADDECLKISSYIKSGKNRKLNAEIIKYMKCLFS